MVHHHPGVSQLFMLVFAGAQGDSGQSRVGGAASASGTVLQASKFAPQDLGACIGPAQLPFACMYPKLIDGIWLHVSHMISTNLYSYLF